MISCKIGQREELPNILFINTNYMDQSTVRIQRTKLLIIIGHGEGHQPRQNTQKHGREALPRVQGQGWRPKGASTGPRVGAVAERSYPTCKEQWLPSEGGLRGTTPHSRSGGAA